jgi:hypothetical protein
MISVAVKRNLLFTIHDGYEHEGVGYCDVVRIVRVEPDKESKTYECVVQKIDRAVMVSRWQKSFDNPVIEFFGIKIQTGTAYPLLFTLPQRIRDELVLTPEKNDSLRTTYKAFLERVSSIEQEQVRDIILKMLPSLNDVEHIPAQSIEALSKFSLWFYSMLPGTPQKMLYYGTDIEARFAALLDSNLKHLIAVAQFYQY